uniref:Uncharacterized protein n=1 Tax=Arundo donax TaxID=35708 RepID=A0A0A9BAL8_ARUDO
MEVDLGLLIDKYNVQQRQKDVMCLHMNL